MKIVFGIFLSIFRFICRLILAFVLMIVILIMYITIPWAVRYAKYDETGVMKNGNLCISHMCEGAGGYEDIFYNLDESVLEEVKDFGVSRGIGGNGAGTVFGKVYKSINSGTSDIYVGYATLGGEDIKYFELYHVEVDKDLNITYSVKKIDKERFIEKVDKERFVEKSDKKRFERFVEKVEKERFVEKSDKERFEQKLKINSDLFELNEIIKEI